MVQLLHMWQGYYVQRLFFLNHGLKAGYWKKEQIENMATGLDDDITHEA